MSDPLAQPCTCDTDDDSWVGETTVPLCPKHEAMLRNLSWDSLACMVVDLSNAIEQPALNAAPAEGLREAARAYRDATGYAMWGTDNEEFVRVWKRDLVGVADAADALRAALKERERLYRALRAVSKVRHVYCLSDGFYSDRFLYGDPRGRRQHVRAGPPDDRGAGRTVLEQRREVVHGPSDLAVGPPRQRDSRRLPVPLRQSNRR